MFGVNKNNLSCRWRAVIEFLDVLKQTVLNIHKLSLALYGSCVVDRIPLA